MKIEKIAKLSRLRLSDEEIKEIEPSLNKVLEAFSVLKDADTNGHEPAYLPIKTKPVLREDISSKSKPKPKGYFTGPRSLK
jgi:aspartyl-tRNA(Asn)/glutamyl-tRNA(Gln) amidotransferase subunit C